MATRPVEQIIRRLTSAEGYLELNLPELALEELERVQEPDEFSVPVMWMTAQALKAQGRFDEAIAPLRHVARSVPGPLRRQVWESLGECLRSAGRTAASRDALATASQFLVDIPAETSPNQILKLELPGIGELEVSMRFDDGLVISIRKV